MSTPAGLSSLSSSLLLSRKESEARAVGKASVKGVSDKVSTDSTRWCKVQAIFGPGRGRGLVALRRKIHAISLPLSRFPRLSEEKSANV